jgi:energy-coupling factor transporter transmembrane protein EcfT
LNARSKIHPVAWMIWSACATLVALLVRNPWYLLLLSAIAFLIKWKATRVRPGGWMLRVYLGFLIIPALMNVIFSRVGDSVLLQLPIRWIGGPYTLEAFLFGVSAGIQIATLLTIMMVFSDLVSPQDLLRRTPTGLLPAGITAAIGLSFIPRAQHAFRALREAQQIRGYKAKGITDLPRLVTPLVILSLEQSISVSESLVSRGWTKVTPNGWKRWSVLLGLACAATGLGIFVFSSAQPFLPLGLCVVGGLVAAAGLRTADRVHRFRPESWRVGDSIIVGASLGASAAILFLSLTLPELLTYYPYPSISVPDFKYPIVAAVGLLSSPYWLIRND